MRLGLKANIRKEIGPIVFVCVLYEYMVGKHTFLFVNHELGDPDLGGLLFCSLRVLPIAFTPYEIECNCAEATELVKSIAKALQAGNPKHERMMNGIRTAVSSLKGYVDKAKEREAAATKQEKSRKR